MALRPWVSFLFLFLWKTQNISSSFLVCLYLFPPIWLVGLLIPGPKWLRACRGWGDAWVAWSRVGLNLFPSLLNFSAASTYHFHFPQIILLPHPLSCLTTACHPWISSPLQPPSSERPLGILSIPSLPCPSPICSIIGTNCGTHDCWKIWPEWIHMISHWIYFDIPTSILEIFPPLFALSPSK